MNSWRTLQSGQLEVNGKVPVLGGTECARFRAQVVDRWGDIVKTDAARAGVPSAWVLGTIWAESGGNPAAKSSDGGYGLMQLTSAGALAGHTGTETIADPALNVRLGAEYLARITRKGDSLVEVASRYNAGQRADGSPHPSSDQPWGYAETTGHITRVVTAANTAVELGRGAQGSGPTPALPADRGALGKLALMISVIRWLR